MARLESKVRPARAAPEHHFDFDRYVAKLGLVPAAVRELAHSKGSSLIEAMCEILGIEVRAFKKALEERIEQIGL